jgi:hypothetical protein
MQAWLVMPTVWNMVVHGARGLVYFCHDFSSSGLGYYAALLEPGMPAAIKAANDSIKLFEPILMSPTVAGTTVTTSGAVPVAALTKRYEGGTYVFAMGNGNASHIEGAAVDAEITVSGIDNGTADVLDETGATTGALAVTNGKLADHFDPYELHIYKITSCADADGDGHGSSCAAGPDCNDNDTFYTDTCPDCTATLIPWALGWFFGERDATRHVLAIAERGAAFADNATVTWESSGITTESAHVFFKRFMLMKVRIDAAALGRGDYRALIGTCSATLKLVR